MFYCSKFINKYFELSEKKFYYNYSDSLENRCNNLFYFFFYNMFLALLDDKNNSPK